MESSVAATDAAKKATKEAIEEAADKAAAETTVEAVAEAITKAIAEAVAKAIVGPISFFLPILVVNIYSKTEAVRIKGVFKIRFSVMTMGTK